MSGDWKPPGPSPIDDASWSDRLVARAIDPTSSPRLHGYAVVEDLARHYTLSDTTFLALSGELPDDTASRRFAVAMHAWSALSIAEAPVHAAVLGRMCGGTITGAVTAGILALGELARTVVARNSAFFRWLAGTAPLPEGDVGDPAYATALREAADSHIVDVWMTRDQARLALLHEAGIADPDRIQSAIVIAGTNAVVAEALRATPADLPGYPMLLPPFHYEETP